VKAYYEWLPRALEGHVGCMRTGAPAMAEAMDVYVEYFISLDKVGSKEECEALREEMERFQSRLPIANVLPKTTAKKSTKTK
jgi:hypothetical protein